MSVAEALLWVAASALFVGTPIGLGLWGTRRRAAAPPPQAPQPEPFKLVPKPTMPAAPEGFQWKIERRERRQYFAGLYISPWELVLKPRDDNSDLHPFSWTLEDKSPECVITTAITLLQKKAEFEEERLKRQAETERLEAMLDKANGGFTPYDPDRPSKITEEARP